MAYVQVMWQTGHSGSILSQMCTTHFMQKRLCPQGIRAAVTCSQSTPSTPTCHLGSSACHPPFREFLQWLSGQPQRPGALSPQKWQESDMLRVLHMPWLKKMRSSQEKSTRLGVVYSCPTHSVGWGLVSTMPQYSCSMETDICYNLSPSPAHLSAGPQRPSPFCLCTYASQAILHGGGERLTAWCMYLTGF